MRKKHPQKDALLYRLVQPGAPSIATLSEETGISKPTLYAWLIQARKATFSESPSIGHGLMKKKPRKHRSPSEKLRLVFSSQALQGEALKAFCEESGVLLEELLSWRDQALAGLENSEAAGNVVSLSDHEALKKDLERKNAALAEASAIILLQKKTSDLFRREK
jgi:transposase